MIFAAAFAINRLTIMIILLVLLVLLLCAALFLGYVSFSRKMYGKIFGRPQKMPQVDRSPKHIDQSTIYGRGKNWFYTNRMEFINVRIDAFDKVKLSGYFRPSADRDCKFVVILLHGYNEHPSEMSAYAKLMMKQIQCHVLMIHQRAHAMSGGKNCTFGMYESVDLMSWIDFVKHQVGEDCRIFLVGRSMGASTALLAAQQADFSENVAGIIADSPFDSLNNTLMHINQKRYKNSMSLFLRCVNKFVNRNLGFDMDRCDIARYAGRIKVPVLFFQGGEDDVVLPQASRRVYDNVRSPKRMVVVDRAKHIMCYNEAPSVYEKETRKFVEECVVRLVSQGRM